MRRRRFGKLRVCACGLAHPHIFTLPLPPRLPLPLPPHQPCPSSRPSSASAHSDSGLAASSSACKNDPSSKVSHAARTALTPPAFHGHAYAAIGFGVLGAGAYHVDQKQCVAAAVRGGELTGAAGRRCSQRRRRPCSSNGRLRTGNGLRARGKRMPCSSLGCSVYQLAPAFSHLAAQLQLQLATPTHNSQLTLIAQPCPSSPRSSAPPQTRSPPTTPDQSPVGQDMPRRSPFILWPPHPPGSNVRSTISKASLTTTSVPPRESHSSRTRRNPSQIPRSFS